MTDVRKDVFCFSFGGSIYLIIKRELHVIIKKIVLHLCLKVFEPFVRLLAHGESSGGRLYENIFFKYPYATEDHS